MLGQASSIGAHRETECILWFLDFQQPPMTLDDFRQFSTTFDNFRQLSTTLVIAVGYQILTFSVSLAYHILKSVISSYFGVKCQLHERRFRKVIPPNVQISHTTDGLEQTLVEIL